MSNRVVDQAVTLLRDWIAKLKPDRPFVRAWRMDDLLPLLDRWKPDRPIDRGRAVFRDIGCARCHVPVLTTGANASPVLHRQAVRLFSDLLLHDVSTGDGIPQGAATDREIRTPALWGLRFRRPLLHDGSAVTIEDAIRRHGGEAERVRALFERLSVSSRQNLIAFLGSL